MNSCYKILKGNNSKACYKVDTVIGEGCFSVSVDDMTDEDELPEKPLAEFTVPGFTYIMSVHAHGYARLLVLGKYKYTPASDEIEVLAVLNYIPSVDGGVGEVGVIERFILLSEYGLKIEQMLSIDGYDVTSSLSKVNIFIGDTKDVVYLDPVTLIPVADTRTYKKDDYAIKDWYLPYFDKDHASIANTYVAPNITDGVAPFFPDKYPAEPIYIKYINPPPCTFDSMRCVGDNITECHYTTDGAGWWNGPAGNEKDFRYIMARTHSSGIVETTEVGLRIQETTEEKPSYFEMFCTTEGTFSNLTGYIAMIKEGIVIASNGNVYFKDIEPQSYTATRSIYHVLDGKYFKTVGTLHAGVFLGSPDTKITGIGDISRWGLMVHKDSKYFYAYNHEGAYVYNLKTGESRNISYGSTYTSIEGVILSTKNDTSYNDSANGTGKIEQKTVKSMF